MHVWGWLVVSLMLAGRSPWIAPADPDARAAAVNAALISANQVTIEVVGINGARPPGRSVERTVDRFTPYLSVAPTIVRGREAQIIGAGERSITLRDMARLLPPLGRAGTHQILLIVWPRQTMLDVSAFYQPIHHRGRWRDVVVMHEPIDVLPGAVRELLWSHVLLHELCHTLRVPADPSHAWDNRHCTHPDCMLYPRLDHRSLLATIRNLGPTWRLCATCRAEVEAAR